MEEVTENRSTVCSTVGNRLLQKNAQPLEEVVGNPHSYPEYTSHRQPKHTMPFWSPSLQLGKVELYDPGCTNHTLPFGSSFLLRKITPYALWAIMPYRSASMSLPIGPTVRSFSAEPPFLENLGELGHYIGIGPALHIIITTKFDSLEYRKWKEVPNKEIWRTHVYTISNQVNQKMTSGIGDPWEDLLKLVITCTSQSTIGRMWAFGTLDCQ